MPDDHPGSLPEPDGPTTQLSGGAVGRPPGDLDADRTQVLPPGGWSSPGPSAPAGPAASPGPAGPPAAAARADYRPAAPGHPSAGGFQQPAGFGPPAAGFAGAPQQYGAHQQYGAPQQQGAAAGYGPPAGPSFAATQPVGYAPSPHREYGSPVAGYGPPPGPSGFGPPPAPMPPAESEPATASRRGLIVGTGVAVVAAAAGYVVFDRYGPRPGPATAPAAGGPSTAPTVGPTGGPAPANVLAKLSAVPVNGGIILSDKKIVLTRETGTTVHAFSAVCTHQGCIVGQVGNGQISCPCHGSVFSATDGSVINGPAAAPLPSVPVTVVGDNIEGG